MTDKKAAHLGMIIQTLLVSQGYTFAGWATKEINPFALMMLRAFGAAAVFGWLFWRIHTPQMMSDLRKDAKAFIGLAVLGTLCNQLLFVLGIKYSTPASSALIYSLTPIIVFLISVFLLRTENFSRQKVVGVCVALIGVAIVILNPSATMEGVPVLLGNLLTTGGLLCWASYIAYSKPMVQKHGAIVATSVVMFLGMLLYFPFGVFTLAAVPYATISWKGWFGLFYLIAVNSALSYYLIFYGLNRIPASQVAIYINLQPVVATLFSALVGGETITLAFVLGGMITLLGVFVLNTAPAKSTSK